MALQAQASSFSFKFQNVYSATYRPCAAYPVHPPPFPPLLHRHGAGRSPVTLNHRRRSTAGYCLPRRSRVTLLALRSEVREGASAQTYLAVTTSIPGARCSAHCSVSPRARTAAREPAAHGLYARRHRKRSHMPSKYAVSVASPPLSRPLPFDVAPPLSRPL